MNAEERDEHVGVCPRCGTEADLAFVDKEKTQVEISCPNCGQYSMPREDFDAEESEAEQYAGPLPE